MIITVLCTDMYYIPACSLYVIVIVNNVMQCDRVLNKCI